MINVKLKTRENIDVKLKPRQGIKIDSSNKYLFDPNLVQEYVDLTKDYSDKAMQSEANAKASEMNAELSAEQAKASDDSAKLSETRVKESELKAKTSENNAKESETKARQEANASAESAYQSQQSALASYEYSQNAEADAQNAQETLEHVLESESKVTQSEENALNYSNVSKIWATGEDEEVNTIEQGEHSSRGYADLSMAIANTPEDVPIDESTLVALEVFKGEKGDKGDKGEKGDKGDMPDISFLPTKEELEQGLATKQNVGDYATNTRVNQVENKIPSPYDDTEIRTLIDEVEETSEQAKAIAEGKATGYVFDTVDDMNTWIATNSNILKLGDNLYIRAVDVPDYWWDGETAQQLETQKVDLSSYVKNTDYAGDVGGVIKISVVNGLAKASNGYLLSVQKTLEDYNSGGNNMFIGKGTLENIKNDIVKRGLTENTIEFTDDEKISARTLIGAISKTDYAQGGVGGVVKASGTFACGVTNGYIQTMYLPTLERYNNLSQYGFIGKGTLETVLTQYSKTVSITEDEYNTLETKDANTLYLIEE